MTASTPSSWTIDERAQAIGLTLTAEESSLAHAVANAHYFMVKLVEAPARFPHEDVALLDWALGRILSRRKEGQP
jgi:hypothetical protein